MDETLVKYLAGLLDADGSMSFHFKSDQNRQDRYFVGLTLNLSSSTAVDKHSFVDTLPRLTGFGSVSYYGANRQFKTWAVSKRADLEMLVPRLVKHMVIKARHWQWLFETWRELRGAYGENACNGEKRRALSEASKKSRNERVGPLKPKNHPTWAWLAGYIDGDGTYHYRRYTVNGYNQWAISVSVVAHTNDISALHFLQNAFGGSILDQSGGENCKIWRRALGYQNRSFAEKFLSKMAKHSHLKREKINEILSHHQQRLSVPGVERRFCTVDGCDKPCHGHGLCQKHYFQKRRLNVSDSLSGFSSA